MGVRKYSTQPAMQTLCTKKPDQNEDDFILKGYETCALQFSAKQFELSQNVDENGFKIITLYVNHPSEMLSWVETCQTVKDKVCETDLLQQGLDYSLVNNPNFEVRYIFENDSPEDQTFQLDYLKQFVSITVTTNKANELLAGVSALALLFLIGL